MNKKISLLLQEQGVAGGRGVLPKSHLLLSEDLQGAGRKGLQAAIDKMEVVSPPPDYRVTVTSKASKFACRFCSMNTCRCVYYE